MNHILYASLGNYLTKENCTQKDFEQLLKVINDSELKIRQMIFYYSKLLSYVYYWRNSGNNLNFDIFSVIINRHPEFINDKPSGEKAFPLHDAIFNLKLTRPRFIFKYENRQYNASIDSSLENSLRYMNHIEYQDNIRKYYYDYNAEKWIRTLIANPKCNLNVQDDHGITPLHHLIIIECYNLALEIVKNGADIHIKNYHDKTPIDLLRLNDKNNIADQMSKIYEHHHSFKNKLLNNCRQTDLTFNFI